MFMSDCNTLMLEQYGKQSVGIIFKYNLWSEYVVFLIKIH